MTIENFENSIIERLKSKITDVEIKEFPDDIKKFRGLTHPKGMIMVRFWGSEYSKVQATDVVVQDKTIQFMIITTLRNLRSHLGVYAYLDAIRIALTGYKMNGCSKMIPVDEKFIDEQDGVWIFGSLFEFKTKAIEVVEDEQLPLLTKLTFGDEYGNAEVLKND